MSDEAPGDRRAQRRAQAQAQDAREREAAMRLEAVLAAFTADQRARLENLPAAFTERLARIVPAAHLAGVLASFLRPRAVSLRVNILRASVAAVRAELEAPLPAGAGLGLEAVPWCAEALVLRSGTLAELSASGPARRGELYVQNLASLTAALALGPRPGERVLDLCAAPGGKTTHLASLMEGRGELIANDRSRARVFRLRAVLAAQGVPNARVSCQSGELLGRKLAGTCDRVLVDAPCSSEARFRADDPRTHRDWKPSKLKRLQAEQGRLLRSGIEALRPGGVLVYSTCTFAPEECELVVQRLLERAGEGLELEPIDLGLDSSLPGLSVWRGRPLDPRLGRTLRLLPDGAREGFFLARLRRRAPASAAATCRP